MGQPRIFVPAKIALQNAAVFGAIEQRSPGFQFAHAVRCFLGVQLRHAWVVQVLPAAHGVREMDAPVISVVHVAHRGRHSALRHHGVGFAQQRFADHANGNSTGRGLDGGAQSRAARANDQDIMFESLIVRHQIILQSVQMPMEHILTYRSENATQNKLHQAQSMCRRLRQLTQS